nr:DUF6603 domain-containing protein [Angustibacter aerolatus]
MLDLAGGVVLSVDAVHDALTHPVLGTASLATLLDGVLLRTAPALGVDPALTDAVADPEPAARPAGAARRERRGRHDHPAGDRRHPRGPRHPERRRRARARAHDRGAGRALGAEPGRRRAGVAGHRRVVDRAERAGGDHPGGGAADLGRRHRVRARPRRRRRRGAGCRGRPVRSSTRSSRSTRCRCWASASCGTTAGCRLGGGARVELAGIAVPLAGASGGDNGVARGVMPSGGSGGAQGGPAPRFSPSLAVQRPPGGDVRVSFSAGSGGGPWWLAVQREFGPIYLEQVGLGVGQDGSTVTSISVLVDGRVSLFGLSASVDDLSLTYQVAGTGSPFDPTRWVVDVAGFAVTADVAGLTLAGGLRRFTPSEGGVEYLGMLLARLGVYGLTVYGGFGEVGPVGDRYSALFLFGAVNGPIGGPPAFFVTGIGGGFGVNRGLVVPADLSHFADFPLIKALDPAARSGDPFAELEQARQFFPASRGRFWFAAGISFTSFALVDGVVVVAVSFGDGFELDVLGLARMALPRPEPPLVSIEPGPGGQGLDPRGRRAGAGPGDRQLVDHRARRPAHRRLRLRGVVRRPEPRPVRPDARRVPPRLPPRRVPGGAAAGADVGDRRRRPGDGGVVLRADVRGPDGGHEDGGARPGSGRRGRTWCSAPTASSPSTRSTWT